MASILKAFYDLLSAGEQDAHPFGLIQSNPVKRRRPREAAMTGAVHDAEYTYPVSTVSSKYGGTHGVEWSTDIIVIRNKKNAISNFEMHWTEFSPTPSEDPLQDVLPRTPNALY